MNKISLDGIRNDDEKMPEAWMWSKLERQERKVWMKNGNEKRKRAQSAWKQTSQPDKDAEY